MNFLTRLIGLTVGMVFVLGASASASILLDDWTLDLSNVENINRTITGISEITYVGMTHNQVITDYDQDPSTNVGEFGVVDGVLTATSLLDGGSIIPQTGMNDSWAMTFDFQIINYNYYQDPVTGALSFVHLANDAPESGTAGFVPYTGYTSTVSDEASGLLNIYIEGGNFSVSNLESGLGYTDGTKIATFSINTGDGGIFTPATYDGSDDATFSLIWALEGVLFDDFYGDLGLYLLEEGALEVLVAITDSNLDGDPRNDPNVGFDIGVGTYPDIVNTFPSAYNSAGGIGGNYTQEDGSAVIGVAVIPEPSTFLLLGAGLLGLGFVCRKRVQK